MQLIWLRPFEPMQSSHLEDQITRSAPRLIVDIKVDFQAWAGLQECSHPTASLQLCTAPLPQVRSAVGETQPPSNHLTVLDYVHFLSRVNSIFLAIAF